MSFVNYVRKRYTPAQLNLTSGVQILVKHIPTLNELTVVSLSNLLLNNAGDPGEISENCPNIEELDISETNLKDWSELVKILSQLPALQFLDLSRLRFDLETIEDVQGLTFPNLKSLVLGKCTLPPVKLAIISRTFPELNSLVFRGSVLNIPETFLNNTFSNIIKLNLAYCRICDFDDLAQLSNFENLAELKLCNNPIGKIEYRSGFLKLKKINVEGTQLVDLVSASQLNIFPSLTEIRMGNTPLSQRLGEHLRKVLMAYLQKATKINGGYIDAKERANHERQFIRDFSEPGNLNEHVTNIEYIMKLLGFHLDEQELEVNKNIFQILLKTHGTVHKFAEVNLAPPTIANLIFETEDGRKEVKEVPLGWKVVNLKKLCQNLFNIPQAKQKLYYLDHELPIYGMELLRFDNKVLWTLKMKDNDVILVRVR